MLAHKELTDNQRRILAKGLGVRPEKVDIYVRHATIRRIESGRPGSGLRARAARYSIASTPCWAAVRMTLIMTDWARPPLSVRSPPQTFRFTTAGRGCLVRPASSSRRLFRRPGR